MYLSKIELFGFKSFAHKVRITFDKGLTAIVGPNGCGKTNVVDAMRWVLGEQKSSLLRSAKMENIIFNGSKNLKPLSFTEVSITIENTRNILPIEYTEVTVTRRLYRSGESGFLLNSVPCRLKDILDLFTDTGMGSDAYSVIELKMIEEIISNKSEERLKLFEEAAGITRYKQRRKQTFKLLESASQDLARVDDVLAEVEKKVRSLKLQVRKAEKLRELKKEIRETDLSLSWLSFEEYHRKLDPLVEKIRSEELLNHELAAKIATEDSVAQEAEVRLLQEETTLSDMQKQINENNRHIHEREKQLLQLEEQRKSLAAEIARINTVMGRDRERIIEQKRLEKELQERKEPCEKNCDELRRKFETLSAEHAALNNDLKLLRDELIRKRKSSSEEQFAANQLAMKKQSLALKAEHLQAAAERIEIRKKALQEKLLGNEKTGQNLAARIESQKKTVAEAQAEEAMLRRQYEDFAGRIEENRELLLQLRSRRDKLGNAIMLASSVLDNFEGMPEGIAFLEKQKNGKPGLGCLSDLLTLDSTYRKAVNAALGDLINYYVCRSVGDARKGIEELKRSGKGKVHFFVLDLVKNNGNASDPAIEGTTKTLDTVRFPRELERILPALLRNSYIVPDLAAAESLAMRYPDCTFVTLEGEVFSGNGMLYGGSSKNSEGIRLGKKAERESLEKELAVVESKVAEQDRMLQQLRSEQGAINIPEQRRKVEKLLSELSSIEKEAARFEAEKNAAEAEISNAGKEIGTLDNQKNISEAELQKLLPSIQESSAKTAAITDNIRRLQTELSSLETRHHQSGIDVQAAQSRWRDSLLELEKLRISLGSCEKSRLGLYEEIRKLETENKAAFGKTGITEEHSATIKNELEKLLLETAGLQKTINERESAYREQQVKNQEKRNLLRDLRRKHDVSIQLIAALARERNDVEQSLDHLLTKARLKYDCDLSVMPAPDIDDSFDPEASKQKLETLLRQREQFGAVNELALEEYEAEKERFDFLTSQKEDLLSAETQLRTTIEEINKTALLKFQETHRAVRKNFIGIFHELFDPEDEVDLLVHASEDPLEAQIEIVARPRGKKPLSIEQLSGGEKALTALSLLFAIYLVKPSPFCILDEVDAPLDDSNVDRFIRLLKKFENNTQFIIVTHNKKTMSSCQALYGVTMEEEGVSKLIPVKLEKTVV
ncbi:MAG: chromosome segregation protein SMC [Chlorobiaceae bacterium]|jgi:chromosome segregation protein|nr:chromosome segregation protein SMC [Chlorobiaceae bacterium]